MRKKLNKAVALFCLTGLIVGGGITNQAKAEDSQNNSLNSAIMGQIPGIPIGSTVSYTFKSSKIASYAACVASEKKPEAGDTQNSKCAVWVPGGWAVPPIISRSDHYETGGSTETQKMTATTFRWSGHHLRWGSITAEVNNGVYQGTGGLSGGGLWGDQAWGDNKYGWQDGGSERPYKESAKKATGENQNGLDLNKGELSWNGGSGGGGFGDLVKDALNDRGKNIQSASGNDWTSSLGDGSGNQNLDGYFNGVDAPGNMPNGLTNDLFGFDTTPVSPPSWFDKSQFVDENGNVRPEIIEQLQSEDFWTNGKEKGSINGQQMWDYYENASGLDDLSGGQFYDQNGNRIDGFYDAFGNPIAVFFDENGNFVDENGNPIKVYDRYGNEITGLFDAKGRPIDKSMFKDINGDGVVNIKDLMQQTNDAQKQDGFQSFLNSIFGEDNSLNKTVQGTLSTQDMYGIAKQILLNAGLDIDDIMNGRNYSKGSAYTEPEDAWDFNRITTLMKARKIVPVTTEEIKEHQEARRKALAKKGIAGFGMVLTDPNEPTPPPTPTK